jgi:hypothetical protein
MKLQDVLHYYFQAQCLEAIKVPGQELNYEPSTVTARTLFNIQAGLSEVKLILHRLSNLSEGNIIDLLQCMLPDEMEDKPADDEYSINMFHADGGNLVNSDVVAGAEFSCRCMEGQISIKRCGTVCLYDEAGDEMEGNYVPRVYHYLLQHHFDLFGLIDAGLAIDSKTIKG